MPDIDTDEIVAALIAIANGQDSIQLEIEALAVTIAHGAAEVAKAIRESRNED